MNEQPIVGKKTSIRLEFIVGCIWFLVLGVIAALVASLFLVPGLNPFTPPPQPSPIILTNTVTVTSTRPPTLTPKPSATIPPSQTPTPTPAALDLNNTSQIKEIHKLGKGVIGQIVYSPDGSRIAVASSTGIRLHNAETLEIIAEFATDQWIASLAYSPDGKSVAAWLPDGSVSLWDTSTSELIKTFAAPSENGSIRVTADEMHNVTFSPDGQLLIAGHGDGSIHIWDIASGELRTTIKASETSIQGLAISADGKLLASAAMLEGAVRIWDAESGILIKELLFEGAPALNLNFSPDGSILVVSGAVFSKKKDSVESLVSLWSTQDWQETKTIQGEEGGASRIIFTPDGKNIVARIGSTLSIIEIETSIVTHTFIEQTGYVHTLAVTPAGNSIVSGADDGTLTIWDIASQTRFVSTHEYSDRINDMILSPDGNVLVTAYENGNISMWNAASQELIRTLNTGDSSPTCLAYSPDGVWLAAGFEDNSIHIWNSGDGIEAFKLEDHSGDINDLEFSSNGMFLASGSEDKTIRIWDMTDEAKMIQIIKDNSGQVLTVSFSADNAYLLGSTQEGEIKLWETTKWKQVYGLKENTFTLLSLISPDGQTFATADFSKLNVRRLILGDVLVEMETEQLGIESLAYSINGAILLTGDTEGLIKVWGSGNGFSYGELKAHNGGVERIIFVSDGKTLITGSRDGTVRFWNTR